MDGRILNETVRRLLREAEETTSWLPWSDEARKVPKRFDSSKPGVGPYEERLAVQLGGTPQGQKTSYDLVDSQGMKWEVKEPGSKMDIRIPRGGKKAVAMLQRNFVEVAWTFIDLFAEDEATPAHMKMGSKKAIEHLFSHTELARLKKFAEAESYMIIEGEISRKRVAEMQSCLEIISKTVGQKISTSDDVVRRVCDLLRIDPELVYNEIGKKFPGTGAMYFSGRAFRDPKGFVEDNWNSVKPSKMFGEVDGVVLVSEEGYRIIDRSRMDEELFFKGISQNMPHLGVKK